MKAARTEIYGPFEVLERLGVGGMATVHRAIERGADGRERVVALKRLLPHLVEDEAFVRAFVREAKLASLLQHGNIVEIYELGRVGASYFISMEYIPGRDLRVIMRHARRVCGPPPVGIALALVSALLDALDYAHRKVGDDGIPLGLVHRDISPSNLIISHTGELKVIDFGIAKATLGYLMTHTGRVKGKLAYMAPEALAGQKVDGRSDLFSASVIAHELLTATPLFAAKDDFQIIERLQNMSPPPPSARNPACPRAVDDIVLRGLAKDPAERWRSAADMRAALAQVAVERHRLASRAEVCEWIEDAFELPASSSTSSYSSSSISSSSMQSLAMSATPPTSASHPRLPLSPPREAPRRGPASGTDEEIVDMVWGTSGPQAAMPVVLHDVPDVSRRSLAFEPRGGRDRQRLAAFAPREPTKPFDHVAVGTAPTTLQPPQELLVEAVSAARRAEAMALAMANRQRPSLLLILVVLAVGLAGVAIAWTVSRSGRHAPPQVAAAPPDAQAQVAQPSAPKVEAMPLPVQAALPAVPAARDVAPPAVQPSPAVVSAEPAHDMRVVPGTPDRGRRRDPGKRRWRRESLDRGRAARARYHESNRDGREDDDPGAEAESDADTAADEDATPGEATPAADEPEPERKARKEKERDRDKEREKESDTAPADEPARAAPSGSRRKGPITVAASRTRRESGSIRPIHFPAGEQAPREIVAKMCIDTGGTVTSVTVLSRVSPAVRNAVERALAQWRYRPIIDGEEKVAACFATGFPVQVE